MTRLTRLFKQTRGSMRPTFDEIYEAVLDTLNICKEVYERAGRSRFAPIVKARQIICYVARKVGYTTLDIGERLGLHHATVLHHSKKAEGYATYEEEYATDVNNILNRLSIPNKQCTIVGYVVRDEDGQLTLFSDKPNRDRFQQGEGFWSGDCPRELNPSLFPQITWGSEPQECELTLRLK